MAIYYLFTHSHHPIHQPPTADCDDIRTLSSEQSAQHDSSNDTQQLYESTKWVYGNDDF